MIHVVIVRDPTIFGLIKVQTEAKKVPLTDVKYKVYAHGNIRIVGEYTGTIEEILLSLMREFNPDTVFFLSESLPVSDEKLSGDIILPNVFFQYSETVETLDIGKDMWVSLLSNPLFLEHYPLQGDYNFESFGLSVGGIHVSGIWNTEISDFRIRLRLIYENDTFDTDLYHFVEAAKNQKIQEKAYPVAYITTEDTSTTTKNLWSIIGFVIGSIDSDLISTEEDAIEWENEEEEWVDGTAEE